MKRALITGFTGQDGTYLTDLLLKKGYKVYGMVRRISTEPPHRIRGPFNFHEAMQEGHLQLVEGDLESLSSLHSIIREVQPHEVYNLAAQSHVGVSFKQPENTININFMGVVNLITAIENAHGEPDHCRIYQASTSEMFGNSWSDEHTRINEGVPHDPQSPYAIAKSAAHKYCMMKREQGMKITCGILFNHESPIRGADFVTQKIARWVAEYNSAILTGNAIPVLELGNLDSKRDWGHAKDYVKAMHKMNARVNAHGEYVIGTGVEHSVRDFVEAALKVNGEKIRWVGSDLFERGLNQDDETIVRVNKKFYRPNDVVTLKANPTSAQTEFDWKSEYDFEELVKEMVTYQLGGDI